MSANAPTRGLPGPRFERAMVLLTHLCAAAILVATLIRLLSTHSRFPWWELDPSRQPVPETTLLPSQALTLDTIVWLAAMLGVGACVMLGRPLRWITGLLALIGCAGAMTTSIFMGARAGTGPDDAVLASAWCTAIIGAWAMSHLAADPAIRRQVFAVIAGAAWVLAAKGAYQVFIEHPATVAHYKANTEAMLAAQGIEPGSTGAREFERRLMQPEATGWVGMSNAHASILAAMLAMTLALAWSAWSDVRAKRLPSGSAGVLTLTAVAAAGGLVMTFSKGGIVAGLLAVILTVWVARPRAALQSPAGQRSAPLVVVAVGLPLLALAAIALRGALGESLGERSLLFRSQYLQASLRIIADSFPLGVGPGGFKAAYALHKPALSPETVESPHSILFDWTACLGVFGVAWCVLLFFWLGASAMVVCGWRFENLERRMIRWAHSSSKPKQASDDGHTSQHGFPNTETLPNAAWSIMWLGVPLVATGASWWRESPTVPPDEWLIRVIALLGWTATQFVNSRISHHPVIAASVFAAAVALATHAQIELTPILPATAATVFLFIALAAANPFTPSETPSEPRAQARAPATNTGARPEGQPRKNSLPQLVSRLLLALPLILLLPFAVRTYSLYTRVCSWETCLSTAAATVLPIARIRSLLPQFADSPSAKRELDAIVFDGIPVDAPYPFTELLALKMSEVVRSPDALLRAAWQARPESQRADDAALRMLLGVAADLQSLGQPNAAKIVAALAANRIGWMDERPYGWQRRGGGAASVAGACEAIHRIDPTPDNRWLLRALELWRETSDLDPTALTPVLRQIDILTELGRLEDARPLAARALELNANLRLDPLKQLGDAQRLKLESLATGPLDAKGGHTGEPNP